MHGAQPWVLSDQRKNRWIISGVYQRDWQAEHCPVVARKRNLSPARQVSEMDTTLGNVAEWVSPDLWRPGQGCYFFAKMSTCLAYAVEPVRQAKSLRLPLKKKGCASRARCTAPRHGCFSVAQTFGQKPLVV